MPPTSMAVVAFPYMLGYNDPSDTPLHRACKRRRNEEICKLLVNGADVTLKNSYGEVAFETAIRHKCSHDIQEILFEYTVDNLETTNGHVLFTAVDFKSPFVAQIIERTPAISVENCDYPFLEETLMSWIFEAEHFKMFLEKFRNVVEEFFNERNIVEFFSGFVACGLEYGQTYSFLENFDTLIDSSVFGDFIEADRDTCKILVDLFEDMSYYLDKPRDVVLGHLTRVTCYLLSYGFDLSSLGVATLYNKFGYSELFKLILHMDVKCTSSDGTGIVMNDKSLIPYMLCDMNLSLKSFLLKPHGNGLPISLWGLWYYTALPGYKQLYSECFNSDMVDRVVEQVPNVPTLVDISRETARAFIIQRFNIKKSWEFFAVLNRLPIPHVCKQILSYEKKLYDRVITC